MSRFRFATLSRVLAAFLSVQLAFGDTFATASFRAPPGPPAPLTSVSAGASAPLIGDNIRSLLSGTGALSGNAPLSGERLLIHVQDIHGHPAAQASISAAVERLVSHGAVESVLLEGLAGELNVLHFRSSPDGAMRDAVVRSLFEEGRLSGAAAAVLAGDGPAPAVHGLESEASYRANVTALGEALEAAPHFGWLRYKTSLEITALKKKHYNAALYLVDLAVSKYEAGEMPLSSLLTFLRHRGVPLEAPLRALLDVGMAERLFDAAEMGSELRSLAARLRGRLDRDDAAALFDAAYRFQKGRLDLDDFVASLQSLCRAHGVALEAYPNIRVHLEKALLAASVSSERLYEGVARLRPAALGPLVRTPEERGLYELDRRARLLGKLADLTLSPRDWAELARRVERPGWAELLPVWSALDSVERGLEPAKNFYRRANQRNGDFAANIARAAAAGEGSMVVVAGGYHGEAIAAAARRLGLKLVTFTPAAGDLRKWDPGAPLEALAGFYSSDDAALDAGVQTLAPPAAPVSALARVAAAHVARGTLTGDAETFNWGRRLFGFLTIDVVRVEPHPIRREKIMRVVVRKAGREQVLEVRFGNAEIAINAIRGVWSRTGAAALRWLKRQRYALFGVTMTGRALHTGGRQWIRIVPRGPGHGVNFIRADIGASSLIGRTIPATLGYVGRNRRRFTGLESRALRVSTVEHLLFAMRTHNIWNADVYVSGEELPIFDGSAQQFVDALRPLAGWSPPPPELRIREPVAAYRDVNTVLLILPLEEDEPNSEYIFIGNYGKFHSTPVEFRHTLDEQDIGATHAALGSHPTFLERKAEDLHALHLYLGGTAYRPGELQDPNRIRIDPTPNYVDASDPADWANGNVNIEAFARHKTMDLIGDLMLLELSLGVRLKARVIGEGTGHRDTGIAMLDVASGQPTPIRFTKITQGNLKLLEAEGKISPALLADIKRYLEPYRDYDERLATSMTANHRGVPAAETNRLRSKLVWQGEPLPQAIVDRVSEYLFGLNGSALAQIGTQVATMQFSADQISRIELRVVERFNREMVIEAAFVRDGMSSHDWPRVDIVVALDANDENVAQTYYNMKNAAADNEARRELPMEGEVVADRSVEFFPRVGSYRYGVFSRQWLSRNFARFAPVFSPEAVSQPDPDLAFGLLWDGGTSGREGRPASDEERAAVARATGEMLTAAFLRLRETRPSGVRSQAPIAGQLLTDINLLSDLLYDPGDRKAALGFIRDSRSVVVEQFLDNILHLKLSLLTERQSKFPPAPGRRLRSEWQPFARNVRDILDGVQAELERTYGPEEGRAALAMWLRRYAEYIATSAIGSIASEARERDRTVSFRQVRVQSQYAAAPDEPLPAAGTSRDENAEIKRIEGEVITPIVHARLVDLNGGGEVLGAARWVARLVSSVFRLPQEAAIRLAPITEGLIFGGAAMLLTSQVELARRSDVAMLSATVAGGIVVATWMLSHLTVLVATRDGARWMPFARVSGAMKLKIAGLGVLVAGLPAIAFAAGGPIWGIAAIGAGMGIHHAVQPLIGSVADGEPEGLVDSRRRISRSLASQV